MSRDYSDTHDFAIIDHGTIVLFEPLTAAAYEWWVDNVQEGPSFGDAFAVEHRYAGDIISGLEAEGFNLGGVA